MVKHIINGITTLCGRTLNDESWPVDHNWAAPGKEDTSTCAKCRGVAGLSVSVEDFLDQIDSIYAFVSSDSSGEGILSLPLGPGGSMLPLIASDLTRMRLLVPLARKLANTGINIRLVQFKTRKVLEEFIPDKTMSSEADDFLYEPDMMSVREN